MGDNRMLGWEPRFETGDASVDFDHQVLFALMQELHCSDTEDVDRTRLREIVIDLVRYANRHFATEESLMANCGYPGIHEHRAAHDHLRSEVSLMATRERLDCLELCLFAYDWLVGHIIAVDMPMIEHVRLMRRASPERNTDRHACSTAR